METNMDTELAICYITGKISADDKQVFEKWLNSSPDNFQQFDDFKDFWNLTGNAYQNYNPDIIEGWAKVKDKTLSDFTIKQNQPGKRFMNVLKIAASILILISLGLSAKYIYNLYQTEDISTFTSDNNIVSITLPDGSSVWLNAHSELKVPQVFKGNKRNVWFKGEAFFQVTKNPEKPFTIYAHGTTTRVLGTSFNLKALDSSRNVCLTLVTGKVWFSLDKDKSKNSILLPGQEVLCDILNGRLQKLENSNENFMAWKTGQLHFTNATLCEVCKVLHEYYHIEIFPGHDSLSKKYLFTGNFDHTSLHNTLNIIELTLGVKVVKTGNAYSLQ